MAPGWRIRSSRDGGWAVWWEAAGAREQTKPGWQRRLSQLPQSRKLAVCHQVEGKGEQRSGLKGLGLYGSDVDATIGRAMQRRLGEPMGMSERRERSVEEQSERDFLSQWTMGWGEASQLGSASSAVKCSVAGGWTGCAVQGKWQRRIGGGLGWASTVGTGLRNT